jgi:hypothetical protein
MIKALIPSFLLVIGLALSELRAQPAAPNPPPTTQQLQQMLDAKQYQDVIKGSQRVLSLKGAAAKDVDKYDTLMIRAEAQLQMKMQGPALESYREAMKATTDAEKQGLTKAMITLLGKSRAFAYTPKPSKDPTHPSTPLNILDPTERKTALKALFDDEWKPNQAKIDALKKQGNTSLTPIIQAAGIAGEMRGLEIAATGSDAETSTALSDLTDNAAKLMTDYLDRESKRVDDIDTRANRPADDNVNGASARMGLTAPQTSELKDAIATCEKLQSAASQVAAAAGSKGSDFKSIAQRAEDLGKKANEVLTADYNGMINTGANMPIQRPGQQVPGAGQIPLHPGQTGR